MTRHETTTMKWSPRAHTNYFPCDLVKLASSSRFPNLISPSSGNSWGISTQTHLDSSLHYWMWMLCGSHTVLYGASFNSSLNVLRVIIMWEISHIIFHLFILSLLDVNYNLWIMFSRPHSIALLSIPHISLFSFTCIEDRLHLPSIRNTTDHYDDVIMGAIASQFTSLTIVCSNVYSDADQRKHQCSASLVFVWGIHWGPVNSPHKWPVTRKMFPFDDVIMITTKAASVLYF